MPKTLKMVRDCWNRAEMLTDGRVQFPPHLEPGEFDPLINSLYRAGDVLERTMMSLGLDPVADIDRIRTTRAYRTAQKLLEKSGVTVAK